MIYAKTLSESDPLQPRSIVRWLVAAAAALACLGQQSPAHAQRGAAPPGRESPAHVALFAPETHKTAYRAFVSAEPIDAVLAAREGDADAVRTPGAWQPGREGALDAFGRSGSYNRSRLARLYGSRTVSVARGARAIGGRVTESWTLLSPYPDPALERLESGTLVLILTVP